MAGTWPRSGSNTRSPRTSPRPSRSSSDRSGDNWAIFVLLIVIGAQFFCGMASVTANSRMIYAFSRDGAVPGHKWWHAINKRTRTPTNAIWLAVVLAWLLVAPAYWYGSIVAYYAVTAIGVIGLYIAYVIPTFLRLRAKEAFKPGPWTLGAKGRLDRLDRGHLGRSSSASSCASRSSTGATSTPTPRRRRSSSSTSSTSRRSSWSGSSWSSAGGTCSPLGSGSQGPKVQGSAEELAAIEAELERV